MGYFIISFNLINMNKQIYLECLREDLAKSEKINREVKLRRKLVREQVYNWIGVLAIGWFMAILLALVLAEGDVDISPDVKPEYIYNLVCVEYGDEEYYKGVAVPDCVQHRWFRYDGNERVEVSAYEVENYYKLNK